MALSIQQLREQREAAAVKLTALVKEFPDDKEWGAANDEEYNTLSAAIDDLDAKIKRHEKVMDLEAARVESARRRAGQEGVSEDEADARNQGARTGLVSWIRGGMENLTDEQRAAMVARQNVVSGRINNALGTGTGAAGGYTTDDVFVAQLIQAMKAFGGMRAAATVIQTDTGSDMDYPTTDATSEEGEIVGENVGASEGDTTFGTIGLGTYKYSSKWIAVPFELLQDSLIDIEAYLVSLLGTRIGRITNRHYTVGTGTGQPPGVVTASAIGKVGTTGQTATVTYDDLIDVQHSVDPAYRDSPGVGFQFHDTTLAKVRKLKDTQGRPLWLPGIAAGDPDRILDAPYAINQHMAPMAPNAKSIAYGDFAKYIIRDVMQVQLFRMTDSKFTEKGQVGFLAFFRGGGGLIDVGGAIKVYQNSAT